MQWPDAIEEYLCDQRQAGRINSEHTERAYRSTLLLHAQDAEGGPLETGRVDIKLTLARWDYPNTRARGHTVLRSFYDWLQEEGWRPENPARQVRKVKLRTPSVHRLTRAETRALIDACETTRQRRIVLIGLCTGARVGEMIQMQRRHFERPQFVWFSADIAKGQRERWTPVLPELEPVVEGILTDCAPAHYVISGYRPGCGPDPARPTSQHAVSRALKGVARRAGVAPGIHPHLLRHAYGDHVAKHAGLHAAQVLMGHASVATTASTYVERAGLDELAHAVRGLRWREPVEEQRARFEGQMRAAAKNFAQPLDRPDMGHYGGSTAIR